MDIRYTEDLPERDQYADLYETTGWNRDFRATAEELETAISRSWFAVSAYHEGSLAGFGRVLSDGVLYGIIADMIVAPSYQRNGIGTTILKRLIDRCRATGLRVIWLFCAAGKSGFYEKQGFARRPEGAPGMQLRLHR